jgi:RNA polymerase-binding transcription factor DksA
MVDASDSTPRDDALFDRLRDEQVRLVEQLEELDDEQSAQGDYDENFADSAQVAAEQGESRSHALQLREQLDDVETALTRLDDGTYGSCSVCEQSIGEARLEAMPTTRWCIEHAP